MANSSLKRYILPALAAAAALLAGGCTDELDIDGAYCPEGRECTVALRVDVADLTELSRAADTDVNTLWVGIYNATSGLCTYNHLYGNEQSSPAEVQNQFKTLTDIEAKSGRSYIVAVANPVGSNGMDLTTADKTKQPLEQLLAAADTWDKYMAIATADARMADDIHISVNAPTDALLMEGSYSAAHVNDVIGSQIEAVDLRPGANTLTGAIHLRRLYTQNTLNISAAGNIISLEVSDIEIYNVPAYSWLRGRNQGDDLTAATAYANVGDAYDPAGPATGNGCYPTSLIFNPPDAVKLVDGVYTFSFWQYENKRTGLAECATYADRDREFKNADNKNTGIYSSLSPSAAGDLNNNATFVKIKANVTYKNPQNMVNPDGLDLPATGESRTAAVTYVVHLGYVGGDAKDFNCYRNSKYTYNITAQSVSDVLVEAFRQGENAPGAEGVVTDVTNEFIELDAHSSAFNIYLTTSEIATFSFAMRTYENGTSHAVRMDENGVNHGLPQPDDPDFKYYNWIELVPTGNTDPNRNANDFAPYPEVKNMDFGRKGVYYPHEMRDSKLQGQWFTVYVNEYTYEKRIGEAGYGDETGSAWKGYVNQPARQAWFNVEQEISNDGESVYFGSKYALRQRSIQTYYDYNVESCQTALGIEHSNESFGMNLRWTMGLGGYNSDNGRVNIVGDLNGRGWETAVNRRKQQVVNGISNTTQAPYADLSKDPTTYSVPANATISVSGDLTYNKEADANDPQKTHSATTQYLQTLYACMNRNRDENGNGTIDLEEIKWYLPSSGNYLRMILGRGTLPTPLMDYRQGTLPAGCSAGYNTLYHYISSDAKIIWVDEGASSSRVDQSADWNKAPWQIRCIRSLGTDLTQPNSQPDPAYRSETNTTTGGGMVKVTHYYGTALREPTAGALPLHKTDAQENKIALYGFEIAPVGNSFDGTYTAEAGFTFTVTENGVTSTKNLGNCGDGGDKYYQEVSDAISAATMCSSLNETSGRRGWRVPNQKEIIIMMRMGVFKTNAKPIMLSCTQEHWANYGTPGSSTLPMSWNYRFVSVNPSIGNAIAPHNNEINHVRCVRDLTYEESQMSYNDLVANN